MTNLEASKRDAALAVLREALRQAVIERVGLEHVTSKEATHG